MLRGRFRLLAGALLVCFGQTGFAESHAEALQERESKPMICAVSPVFGWDRNELKVRGRGGQVTTETDTAPEYGLFLLMAHPNLVINDFLFWTDVNHTDVFGNLAFVNGYGDSNADLTWNVGAGHLYHKIEPANEDITVTVPMVKAGPLFRVRKWNLRLNPYVGYAWERIETRRANEDNDSYLYGITAGWRRRMAAATVKYYFQDSQEADDDYHTVRARAHCMFTRHWGGVVRFDYMEHVTSDDTSLLVGPTYVF